MRVIQAYIQDSFIEKITKTQSFPRGRDVKHNTKIGNNRDLNLKDSAPRGKTSKPNPLGLKQATKATSQKAKRNGCLGAQHATGTTSTYTFPSRRSVPERATHQRAASTRWYSMVAKMRVEDCEAMTTLKRGTLPNNNICMRSRRFLQKILCNTSQARKSWRYTRHP